MSVQIKAPSPGESIAEVQIAAWLKSDGEKVEKNDTICEIESDKATLEVAAEVSGVLHIKAQEGDIVKVGSVICEIDEDGTASVESSKKEESKKEEPKQETKNSASENTYATGAPSPTAKKILDEKGVSASQVSGTGRDGRITKDDAQKFDSGLPAKPERPARPGETRKKMSMLRRKLSQRLVAVKNETAMLTTFNEVDMQPMMALRKEKQEAFQKKYDVKLGFMSFFVRAVVESLKNFPEVNAMIDGDEIIYHDFVDVGIAVSAPKGLVVPPVRNAHEMNSGEIEQEIMRLANKARENKLSIEEMTGGTFTVTNGGVFGSMLSTPIINPPQSAILGMHNIVERPVARDGEVVIRPIMYVALSYDHRIIDGRESVGFLKSVKEKLEDPKSILTGI